jgi:hypothetical protein
MKKIQKTYFQISNFYPKSIVIIICKMIIQNTTLKNDYTKYNNLQNI